MTRRLAALALLLGLAAPAAAQEEGAIDFDASGSLRIRGFYLANDTPVRDVSLLDPTTRRGLFPDFDPDQEVDATQTFLDTRLRLAFRAVAYEEVEAYLGVEVGDLTFGVASQGGSLGTDGIVFENKNLYLEWRPRAYSFRVRGGLYPRESDPYGIVLSDDVAGVQGEVELLGTETSLYADFIKAVENSRVDLDGDGIPDNDYNDRTIAIAGLRTSAVPVLDLEAFFLADIDDTRDTPDAADTERDVLWWGANARLQLGPVRSSSTAIWAWGEVDQPGPDTTIRGFAADQRLELELPFVIVEALFGYATGRDPRRQTTDTAFPVIAPFYGTSGIIYTDYAGFSVTGSSLSGTAHATLKLKASPAEHLDLELVFQYAWFTSDRDVSNNELPQNQGRTARDAREIGYEVDLNASYEVVHGFKFLVRTAVLFPGRGFQVSRDTRREGVLGQVIVGAQLNF